MKLRKWLRNRELKRLQKQKPKTYPGYDRCQRVAVFFTAGQPNDQQIKQFEKRLQTEGKEVFLLAYFPYKKKEQAASFEFPNYASNEVNWLSKPNSEDFNAWVGQEYDAFVDLNTSAEKSFAFVRSMINAKLCIGFEAEKQPWADVSLKLNPRKDFERAQEEILKYLKFINNAS